MTSTTLGAPARHPTAPTPSPHPLPHPHLTSNNPPNQAPRPRTPPDHLPPKPLSPQPPPNMLIHPLTMITFPTRPHATPVPFGSPSKPNNLNHLHPHPPFPEPQPTSRPLPADNPVA